MPLICLKILSGLLLRARVLGRANYLVAYSGMAPVLGPYSERVHERYYVVVSLPCASTIGTIDGLSGR